MLSKTAAISLLAALPLTMVNALPQDSATTDIMAVISECVPATTLLSYATDIPIPASDLESYLYTMSVTDYCNYATAIPKSLQAEWSSYETAISSWEKVHSSEFAAISSFYSSASGNPACSSYLPSATASNIAFCSTGAGSGSGSGTTTGKGASSTGGSSGSSSGNSTGSNAATHGATGSVSFMIGGFVASCLAAVALL
jgi:hypothetical protein